LRSDLDQRLRKLQAAHAAEVIDDAAYQAGLARLRAGYGAAAVDALLHGQTSGRSHQTSGHAQVGQMISGDVHGSVTVGRMDFGDRPPASSAAARPASGAAPLPAAQATLPATLSVDMDRVPFSYGHPLDQRPLLYASEVDQNFAMALRPGGAPASLSVEDQRQIIRALAEVEITLAAYASEAAAPAELVRRRDLLLSQLGG
jgi:hypothetical protein